MEKKPRLGSDPLEWIRDTNEATKRLFEVTKLTMPYLLRGDHAYRHGPFSVYGWDPTKLY
ncbi:MAG: hypothetical protein ABSH06_00375 [Thermodesulfobacteriota bacterium]|jgi:hypothetical protein